MSFYYYAGAALPMLFFGESAPINEETFLELCREQLKKADYIQLTDATIDNYNVKQISNPVTQMWRKWEVSIRNELAKLRAQEKGKDPEPYIIESESVLGHFELAKETLSNTSPYEAETALYEARWNYLEELGTNRFFTLESLIVYYLKLQILEKLEQFTRERGGEHFEEIYRKIREGTAEEPEPEEEKEIIQRS